MTRPGTQLQKPWAKDLPLPVIIMAKKKAVEATSAWNDTVVGILKASRAVWEVREKIGGAPSGSFISWGEEELQRSSFTVSALAAIGARYSLFYQSKNALPPFWGTLYELSKAPPDVLRRVLRRVTPDMERNDVIYLLLEETADDTPPKVPQRPKKGKQKKALAAPSAPQPGPREAANTSIMAGAVWRTVKDFAARVDHALLTGSLSPEAKRFMLLNYLGPSREQITALEKRLTESTGSVSDR